MRTPRTSYGEGKALSTRTSRSQCISTRHRSPSVYSRSSSADRGKRLGVRTSRASLHSWMSGARRPVQRLFPKFLPQPVTFEPAHDRDPSPASRLSARITTLQPNAAGPHFRSRNWLIPALGAAGLRLAGRASRAVSAAISFCVDPIRDGDQADQKAGFIISRPTGRDRSSGFRSAGGHDIRCSSRRRAARSGIGLGRWLLIRGRHHRYFSGERSSLRNGTGSRTKFWTAPTTPPRQHPYVPRGKRATVPNNYKYLSCAADRAVIEVVVSMTPQACRYGQPAREVDELTKGFRAVISRTRLGERAPPHESIRGMLSGSVCIEAAATTTVGVY